MPRYIIERTVPGASHLTKAELADIAGKSNSVVSDLGVPYTWLHTYVAGDKLYCVHDAPDAETVAKHGANGGFPVDSITEVVDVFGPLTAR